MMRQFPLLDLESAWQDAHRALQDIMDMAEALYDESEHTWEDMVVVRRKARAARATLNALPAALLDGIAKDRADLEEQEAHAPENVNGY
jgi:hypothetical protein